MFDNCTFHAKISSLIILDNLFQLVLSIKCQGFHWMLWLSFYQLGLCVFFQGQMGRKPISTGHDKRKRWKLADFCKVSNRKRKLSILLDYRRVTQLIVYWTSLTTTSCSRKIVITRFIIDKMRRFKIKSLLQLCV